MLPPDQIHDKSFTLLKSEARHAALVLRKKPGDIIDFFDEKDLSYQGRITSVGPDRVEGVIISQEKAALGLGIQLVLCQALIKGPKWDWLVEKASEIGVSTLVPLITARTVVKPSRETPHERWKRIALAASKQCGRSDVMKVEAPISFTEAISNLPEKSLALIPWEKESTKTIRQAVSTSTAVYIFIGPEGGWETSEVDLAIRHHAIPVRLGPTLLRSETAGLVAATLVLSKCGVYS